MGGNALVPQRRFATLVGFTAVIMWSLLAVLTAASGTVPPFQLTAMAFAIGGGLGAGSPSSPAGNWPSSGSPYPFG